MDTMPTEILIGAVAKAADVNVGTIRFYEREGLLPEPPRSDAGYRLYDAQAVRRVRFIRKAKELGFTLAETKELLDLRVTDTSRCEEVAGTARRKIESVDERIEELARVRRALEELVRACDANEETSECPILEALEDEAPPDARETRRE